MRLDNKRHLVTGGSGFLGQVVCSRLRDAGGDVTALRSAQTNLVFLDQTVAAFEQYRPDTVFHLAASVGGIGANQRNPGRFFYENMQMGMNVLEAARLVGVSKMVLVGTICSYPKFTPVPFREDDLWNGYPEETNAPYGVAKKALITMAQAYRQQYGLNAICMLPVNLYGPGDNFDLKSSHVIPAMIRKCVDATDAGLHDIVLWGDGTPTREFLYVDDCAQGLVLAAERYDGVEPVNLGAGFEIRMRDLADMIVRLTGFQGSVRWDTSRPNGQPRRMLDTTRAKEQFGFSAQTSFEQGLTQTITWYQQNKERIRQHEPAISS